MTKANKKNEEEFILSKFRSQYRVITRTIGNIPKGDAVHSYSCHNSFVVILKVHHAEKISIWPQSTESFSLPDEIFFRCYYCIMYLMFGIGSFIGHNFSTSTSLR